MSTQLIPMPGWALCRTLPHRETLASGLILPGDIDKNVRSEGVAQIVAATPPHLGPMGVAVGDRILYRGFLRFANPVGSMLGAGRGCEFFFLNLKDILAVVVGPGTVGLNGEYEL